MYKKILLIICLFVLTGCSMYYINNKSLQEIINITINSNNELHNVNNIGFRYYLPISFEVYKDDEYNQVLTSNGNKYFLYVDIVSYHYKNALSSSRDINDYEFFTFNNKDKTGYLKITQVDKHFFVELCYNYAIIEVEVEESKLRYAIAEGTSILNSIKYNDTIIEKYIGENDIESSETIYKIPSPEKKSEQNVLEHIDQNENTVNNDQE